MRLRTPSPPPDLAPATRPVPAAADLGSARRRSTWRTRVVRAAVVAAVLLVLGAATWAVGYSSLLAVEGVRVTGAADPLAGQVATAAEVPLGQPLARVDIVAIGERVGAVPEIADVAVSREWPRTVGITVVPRTPLASIDQDGQWRLVDAEGVVFSAVPEPAAGLPVLVAEGGDVGAQARAAGVAVAVALPSEVLAQVEQIEAGSAVEVRLVLRDGRRVLWGSARDAERKAEVLTVLLQTPAREYDVSVPDRPTLRPS